MLKAANDAWCISGRKDCLISIRVSYYYSSYFKPLQMGIRQSSRTLPARPTTIPHISISHTMIIHIPAEPGASCFDPVYNLPLGLLKVSQVLFPMLTKGLIQKSDQQDHTVQFLFSLFVWHQTV